MQKLLADNYFISDDKQLLQVETIHNFLKDSYWAKNIPLEVVRQSIKGSYCIGLYKENAQVGFARLITDYATFAYLADVFVLEAHRGKGLSKEIMTFIMELDWVKKLRNIMLATQDAHELYKPYGFTVLNHPARYMYRFNLKLYDGE